MTTQAVFPKTLFRNTNKPIVYFDQFAWLGLVKAHKRGVDENGYLPLARRVIEASKSDQAHFIISSVTYMESENLGKPEQRVEIGDFIAGVSRLQTIVPRHTSLAHEVATSLGTIFGSNSMKPQPLLGVGVRHAFGQPNLPLFDIPANLNLSVDQRRILNKVAEANLEMAMLTGEMELAAGSQPQKTLRIGEQLTQERADSESNLRELLDSEVLTYRKEKLFDVLSARELVNEIVPLLTNSTHSFDHTMEDLVEAGLSIMNRFLWQMPGMRVTIGLKAERHRNPQNTWKRNPIYDIRHMETAFPYSDLVMADAEITNAISNLGLDKEFGTQVTNNAGNALDALEKLLD